MTAEQRQALPQRWCLMRSQDASRTGWVAQRYLEEDSVAADTAAAGATREETAAWPSAPCSRPHVAALGSMRIENAHLDIAHQDAEQFVIRDGFTLLGKRSDSTFDQKKDFYSTARFPDIDNSVLMPDARLAAVTRAMLEFDFAEGGIEL